MMWYDMDGDSSNLIWLPARVWGIKANGSELGELGGIDCVAI